MIRQQPKVPTVDVISDEQTSQTYLTPPSLPLEMVFFRMTPISSVAMSGRGVVNYPPVYACQRAGGHAGRVEDEKEGSR